MSIRVHFRRRKHFHATEICNILSLSLLVSIYYISSNHQHIRNVEAANVAINNRTVEDWTVEDVRGINKYKPMFINNHSIVPHDDVSHWPVNTYYWHAPEAYYQWKIYTYGGDLKFLVSHVVTRGDTSGKYLDEPDLVLEGGSDEHFMKIGYKLPKEEDMIKGYDKNQTVKMPLSEPGWFYLIEQEDENNVKHLKLGDVPVSRADFSLVLAGLNRSLIRAKYHMDQVEGDLYDVNMNLLNNKSRTVQCDNDCSGVLLDDLDDIDLLFDEIRRLAPLLKDGPWRRLAYLNKKANNLAERLSHYLKLIALGKEVIENFALNFDQETLADILELRANHLDSRAPNVAFEAYQTRLLAEKTLEELLKSLWDKIRNTIKLLNEHGFGPSGVSPGRIERIVSESEIILRELRNRNFKPILDEAERELRKAKLLLEKIRTLLIDPEKSNELLKRLEQLQKVLVDFSRIVQEQVVKPTEKANELVSEGKKKYAALLALLKEAADRSKESQANLDEARRLLDITKKCLADEALYLDQLPRQLAELNSSLFEIEKKRSILTSVNPDYQRKYVDKCREHGDFLVKKSQELDGLFNATRDVADYAMKAARVYQEIVEAILGAEKAANAAQEAADKAYKMAVPDFDQSLADKAKEAKRKSLELLEKAKKLREQDVQRLAFELAKRKQIIDQLFEQMKQLIGELEQINAGLKQLADKNFLEQLQDLDGFLKRLFERLAEIHKRLQLLSDIIYNSLLPQYERLLAGSQSSLGNLGQEIEAARQNLLASIKYAANSKLSLEKILRLEAKLDLDLDLLRRKIQLAHQEAGTVHVSLMPSSETGVCTRSYFIPAILSAPPEVAGASVGGFNVKKISLIWTLHGDEAESLLLFIGSKQNDEFIALEMYERKIRLVYSLNSYSPSGVQVLAHPLSIELNDKGLLSDDAWYLIEVYISNDEQIRLSVRPVPKANERDQQQVSHRLVAQAGASSKLQVSPYGEAEINMLVGGLPAPSDFSVPSQLKSSRLTGCMYNLELNDQQLGLWNFKTNQGCEGCMEGPLNARPSNTFSLTGTGSYASVTHMKSSYDRSKYMVSMSLKTTDKQGLIFLGLSETTNHYLSIFLNKGRIVYLVGKLAPSHANFLGLSSSSLFEYSLSSSLGSTNSTSSSRNNQNQKPIEHMIISNKEYNNGQWVKITAEKDQDRLVLVVDDEYKESVADEKLATLDMDLIFFGGVWPLIRPIKYANTSMELSSLAGCIKDIQIETSPIDLLRRQSYGVERGCYSTVSGSGSQQPVSAVGVYKLLQDRFGRVAYPLPAGR